MLLHRIENSRAKTIVWLIVASLAAIPWTRQAKGDDPAEVYSRICQEYLDGKWDALDADLRAAKNSAGLSAAQQADVAYIRQAVAECRPPWWTQAKAGKKVAIRPVVWGQPLNLTYDPAGQGGVQAHFAGNTMSLTASWPAAEMDNPDQAEHGFTKGELNNLGVWSTLGMAKVWSQTPPQSLAGLSEAGKLRLLRGQDFRGAVTGLYYGTPRARRWGEFLYLLSWLEKYAKMPTVYSRKAAGAMFLAEVLANPEKYPSLPLPKTLAGENAEEKLAECYRNRIEKSGWSVAEDRSLREALKKFAAANDLSVYKTQAVTLPNKLVVALDPDADTALRTKRDAWLKARFDEAKEK